MELTVESQKRLEGSKPKALRRAGLIPAVLYGHNKAESISLTVKAKAAEILIRDASVNNTLIDLKITDIPWSGKSTIAGSANSSVEALSLSLELFAVASQDSLTIEVPLHFVGDAAGVKLEGGMLDTVFNSLQVQCAPDNIPNAIEIDVTALQVGGSLHIHEIPLPPGVTALTEPGQVVVSVLPPQVSAGETEAETT